MPPAVRTTEPGVDADVEAGKRDRQTRLPRPPVPQMFFTAEEMAASLAPEEWEVLVTEARPRPAKVHEGREITVRDAVLRARRRRR
jgi:hypothetical protein